MSKKSASSESKNESNPSDKVVKRVAKKAPIKKEEKDFGETTLSKNKEEKKAHQAPKPKKFFEDEDELEVEKRFVKKERKPFDKDKKHFGIEEQPLEKGKKHFGNEVKTFDKSKKPFKRDTPTVDTPSFDTDFKPKFPAGKEKPRFDREKKPYEGERKPFDRERKPFDREKKPYDGERKPFDRDKKPFDRERKPFDREKKPYDGERKPFDRDKKPFDRERKPFDRERKPYDKERKPFDKERKPFDGEKRPYIRKEGEKEIDTSNDRVVKELAEEVKFNKRYKGYEEKPREERPDETTSIDGEMMLNKYIAHSGECSRRDAAEMVKQGKVRVNGELILQPAHRVLPGDTVTLGGKKLTPQRGFVYILLNKPKDFITTTEDPQERKTVMELVQNAGVNRLFPIGRLDRKTTGLLLLTNDGNLAHRLSHPSFNIKKVYQVTLNKNLTTIDYHSITKGVMLEDGMANVDSIAYLENRNEIGLEIHSGKNRIVRRIFESMGYTVDKLDRVMYAGLTKKNLPRGKWRFLEDKEVIFLKHFK